MDGRFQQHAKRRRKRLRHLNLVGRTPSSAVGLLADLRISLKIRLPGEGNRRGTGVPPHMIGLISENLVALRTRPCATAALQPSHAKVGPDPQTQTAYPCPANPLLSG